MTTVSGVVASGPLLVVCRGHRCDALLHRCGADLTELRTAVRQTRGAVMVHSQGCLGSCEHAPVAVLGEWAGEPGRAAPGVLVGGLDDAARRRALALRVREEGSPPGPGTHPVGPAPVGPAPAGPSTDPAGCAGGDAPSVGG